MIHNKNYIYYISLKHNSIHSIAIFVFTFMVYLENRMGLVFFSNCWMHFESS